MTNARNTKRALWSSVVSLMLCFAMLLGTTYAWFTDSVTSQNNVIKSGNLDIELEYWNGSAWVDVKDESDILTNTLWEPGATEVAYLRVANAGSLALKYRLGVNIVEETDGVNVAGNSFKLSDYIMFGVANIAVDEEGAPVAYDAREEAISAVTAADAEAVAEKISVGFSKSSALESGDELYLALVVYMPTTVGNVANHNGTNVPKIELGINIFATQYTFEEDSFGSDYDAGAPWTGMIDIEWYLENPDATEYVLTSAEELAGLAAIVNGTAVAPVATYAASAETQTIHETFMNKTIKLGGNIDLNELEWTPVGRIGASSTDFTYAFKGIFDGQGHTVANLEVSNEGWAGLFGIAHSATISNVTVDGATILSNRMAGAVVGQLYGSIDNCHVKNADIKVIPNLVGDTYDNGDKVGGIVGWLGDNGNNRTLTNCTATNVKLGAYRDVGGIAGYVASSTTVKDNSIVNVEIVVDQTTNYYGDKDVNAGYICGRVNGTITEENNSNDEDSIVKSTYSKNGLTLKDDGDGNVTLYRVPESYEGATLIVPEGVTKLGSALKGKQFAKLVIPSTVKAAYKSLEGSTIDEVVISEGATTIPDRMFYGATIGNVEIPDTVTVIEQSAFAKAVLTEVVIPASVTTIEEAAFTHADYLETVTIMGNTAIQGFAFRGCDSLRNVYLYGDDVTFVKSTLNGRDSTWFCNNESNNANTSNITFTVRSEEIKERVLTAMGAERNNTPVIVDDGSIEVTNVDDLVEVLANGGHAKLTADLSVSDTIVMNGGILNGNGYTISFTKSGSGSVLINPTGGVIKNVNIVDPSANMFDGKYAIGSNQYAASILSEDLVLENVNISGFKFFIDVNANGHSVTVKNGELANCVQVVNAEMTTFEGCHIYADVASQMTFNQPNTKQAIIYLMGDMTFTDCHFEEDANIYLDSSRFSGNVYFNNSTYGNNGVENRPIDSFGFIQWWFPVFGVHNYPGTFGDTKPAQTHFSWYIDGVQVWAATAIS